MLNARAVTNGEKPARSTRLKDEECVWKGGNTYGCALEQVSPMVKCMKRSAAIYKMPRPYAVSSQRVASRAFFRPSPPVQTFSPRPNRDPPFVLPHPSLHLAQIPISDPHQVSHTQPTSIPMRTSPHARPFPRTATASNTHLESFQRPWTRIALRISHAAPRIRPSSVRNPVYA